MPHPNYPTYDTVVIHPAPTGRASQANDAMWHWAMMLMGSPYGQPDDDERFAALAGLA